MRYFKHLTVWIEDPETGNQREFELGVTLDVGDAEDAPTLLTIEEAFETDFSVGTGPRWPQKSIEVQSLPDGTTEEIKFHLEDHKYEIYDESRKPEHDYHFDAAWERNRERRYENS